MYKCTYTNLSVYHEYLNVFFYLYVYVCVFIYIYIERERERERESIPNQTAKIDSDVWKLFIFSKVLTGHICLFK